MGKHYLGNPLLKAPNVQINYTQEQLVEFAKCAEDPIYFIENYIKVVSLDKGLVPFTLYDFQKRIINTIHSNRFTISKIPRQSGKTTSTTSYLLHYCLFNPNARVAILANKGSTAKDILDKFKKAYENLPIWLQQGVVEWNKFSVEMENGSKIIAANTSASAVRGGSYNIIVLDEFGFVSSQIAEEFISSVYPTIAAGANTKMVIISTPNGMNHFYKYWTDAEKGNNDYVPVSAHWTEFDNRGEEFKLQTIRNTSEMQWNQEFECDFLGSENTLISGSKLRLMDYTDPKAHSQEGFDVHEDPIPDHVYTICVDTSQGLGMDYHAFSVIDSTKYPFKQVAKFRNNSMSHQVLPYYIKMAGTMYNMAHVLIEIKDLGQSIAEMLQNEFEYPNIIQVSQNGKKGQVAGNGFGKGSNRIGLVTSNVTKKVGCSVLKDLIEQDKLFVCDYHTISEFSNYVSDGKTYKATDGNNDDVVSTLVMFAWLSTQEYFKEITNTDIRKRLIEDKIEKLKNDIAVFGFFDNGKILDEQENIDIFDERTPAQKQAADEKYWKELLSGDDWKDHIRF